LLGYAKANRLDLDDVTPTSGDASELRIADRVLEPASLEEESSVIAERFAEPKSAALQSLTRSMDLVELNLSTTSSMLARV
jgi:hypothetical protein